MKLNIINIRKSINKAFLKVKPNRTQIEIFKNNILNLYDQINESESEEYHKNNISKFLTDTYYSPDHYINTKGRTDLVIHNGKDSSSTVGVLIETKKPSNKSEMPTKENLNAKALQELILYYLRERISGKNIEVKHLIVTNIYEWFIFNANDFDRLFAQNKKLVKQFTDFEEGRLADTKTDFFYKQIAEPFLKELDSEISFTHLDIRNYEKIIKNDDKPDNNKLVALFKLFSPENLLKLPFANDSNSLDKGFYAELLHIIGLQETKEGSKKLIGRKAEKERNAGSLIENTVTILKYEDCLSQIKASDYGNNQEEQLYNVALELVITWINRVLFLKLLEGQLVKYHSGDKSYKFLNVERIPDFDALNKLFFQVLAIKESERNDIVKKKFGNIPYLNSSLFEPNELEHKTVRVSNLEDEYSLPILSSTVLKEKTGKRKSGELNTLQYLIEFLDSYDFTSEGAEEIQEENKRLINASVLGLIFEKINGYKDGSFFTPGFITMYMCRETIRRAVVQKFNETQKWNCKTLDDVYDKIEDKEAANKIINDLKICDPAVGSGHFLVSALNEIIAIKNDLRILSDREGKRLKEYQVEVVNDELIITDEDGELFDYNPKNRESQRIQETLFHEKQTIIENCLFGVDINPNSVKICRLRLWIELLKNAYYKNGTEELETLPNIDINIKCGNSLISRFDLDSDLKQALRKSESKWTVDSYRLAVASYRHAESKEHKHEMERLINEIKTNFRSEISQNDPKIKRLRKLNGELFTLTNQGQLFELSKKEKSEWNKKVSKLTEQTQKLEKEIEEIKNNKIYENAFEWRFEFPEVLNDDGDFVGFDVVIGNPPYIFGRDWKALGLPLGMKTFFKESYSLANYQIDLYILFLEKSFYITKNSSNTSLIVPNTWLNNTYAGIVRSYLLKNTSEFILSTTPPNTFEGVGVDTVIVQFSKQSGNCDDIIVKSVSYQDGIVMLQSNKKEIFIDGVTPISLNMNSDTLRIISKINETGIKLGEICMVTRGIHPYRIGGYGKSAFSEGAQTSKDVEERPYHSKTYKPGYRPFVYGKNLKRLSIPVVNEYVKYGEWIAEPRNPTFFEGGRVYSRKILSDRLLVTYVDDDSVADQQVYITKPTTSKIDARYLAGLLGSKMMSFYIRNFYDELEALFPQIKVSQLKELPISINSLEKQQIISEKVVQIINLKKENSSANTIELEDKIDHLIYDLYGFTEEEIKIIEVSQ
ncbi:MAG: Eco57I restriction-modification methylase domain-containing protein [Prolixibacteraceae bacterium]|nr:Eco57I restriction-modification methylase domain-containing protein [Prolixibacteraceae bacterium]